MSLINRPIIDQTGRNNANAGSVSARGTGRGVPVGGRGRGAYLSKKASASRMAVAPNAIQRHQAHIYGV